MPAGTEIELGFRLNSGAGDETSGRKTETFVLDSVLLKGERLPLTFSSQMSFAGSTGNRERIEVFVAPSFNDESAINNIDYREVFVTAVSGKDLSFEIRNLGNTACEPNEIDFQFRLRNEGCETIPAGTKVEVDFSFLSHDEKYEIELPNDLAQNSRFNRTVTVSVDTIPGGEISFSGILTYPEDESGGNNDDSGELQLYNQTGADFYENFDDFDPEEDPDLFIDNGGKNLIRTTEYSGETMLGFTTTNGGGTSILRDCNLLSRILKGHDGYDSRAQFCVDLTGVNNPTLSFDLAQFRGENSFGIPAEYSSIFFVRTSDPGFEEVMIVDQTEGEIVTHNYALPVDF